MNIRRSRFFSRSFRLGFAALLVLSLAGGAAFWLLQDLPDIGTLPERLNPPSIRITDQQGRLLYEALPENSGRHTRLPLDQIPLAVQQATIATEDSRFYQNPGVDLQGIVRAFWINLQGGEALAGGSTITQQVARTLLLSPQERAERTLRRKLRESWLAWQLARHYSKEEILALYLNETYYGGMAYGIEAAAQTFFGRSASQLDPAQAALLAGLPQTPAAYNPITHPEAAKQRQAIVLGLMEKQGYLTADQRRQAEQEPLTFASRPYPTEALHFVLYVQSLLDEWLTPQEIYQSGGITVQTTLNLDWQHLAEKAVREQIAYLRNPPDGVDHQVSSAALVALDARTGAVRALVGSPEYFNTASEGAINMAISPRQPGSAIKPLVYACALDPTQPDPWTAATMLLDVRAHFVTHDGYAYSPKNYDNREHGPVSVRTALASSLNIPAVLTLQKIGLPRLFDQAARMGITRFKPNRDYDLSLALGGGEVTLLELTGAYGAFASGGLRVTPYAIQTVYDSQGRLMKSHTPPASERVLDARVAWLISDILSDDEARAIGFGRNSALKIGQPAAVKTGTTTDYHDNWTVGYTPDVVVGVWAGNSDYRAMHNVSGLTGAAPIWHTFLRSIRVGQPQKAFQRPPGLVSLPVCAVSGLLPTASCTYQRSEWFIEGTQPRQADTIMRTVTIDAQTGLLADENTPPDQRTPLTVLNLPPEAREWAHTQGLQLFSDLHTEAPGAPQTPRLVILFPGSNSVFQLTRQIPASDQQIQIRVDGEAGLQDVSVLLDGRPLAQCWQLPCQVWWPLNVGKHQLQAQARTAAGEGVQSPLMPFEVRPPTP